MGKYTFVKGDTKTLPDGRVLYRIIATKNFGTVTKGMPGGYVQSKRNLSGKGNCWIGFFATAAGNSRVNKNALLIGNAYIDDYAIITDDAVVNGNVQCFEHVLIGDKSRVGTNTILSGACTICGNAIVRCQPRRSMSGKTILPNVGGIAMVRENAILEGRISIRDCCIIEGKAIIRNNARLTDNVYACGNSIIEGSASLSDNVKVFKNARIGGRSKLRGESVVTGKSQIYGKSVILCNAFISGKARVENATISGDIRCNYEIIKKRRLKPSTTICEPKRGTPASSLQPAAEKAP